MMTDQPQTTLAQRSRKDVEARVQAAISRELDRNFDLNNAALAEVSSKVLHEVMRALINAGVQV